MIAPTKPTCPHCAAMLQERTTGKNAAFDWTFDIFECGTYRQAYAKTEATVCERRSDECKANTGTVDAPERRTRYGSRLSRKASAAAMDGVANGYRSAPITEG